MTLKRYRMNLDASFFNEYWEESEDGPWVKYEDAEELEVQLAIYKEALDILSKGNNPDLALYLASLKLKNKKEKENDRNR